MNNRQHGPTDSCQVCSAMLGMEEDSEKTRVEKEDFVSVVFVNSCEEFQGVCFRTIFLSFCAQWEHVGRRVLYRSQGRIFRTRNVSTTCVGRSSKFAGVRCVGSDRSCSDVSSDVVSRCSSFQHCLCTACVNLPFAAIEEFFLQRGTLRFLPFHRNVIFFHARVLIVR